MQGIADEMGLNLALEELRLEPVGADAGGLQEAVLLADLPADGQDDRRDEDEG